MAITITTHNGALSIKTPYDARFVAELKRQIPQADRHFTGKPDNAWVVDVRHGQAVQKIVYSIWGQYVKLPMMAAAESLTNHQLWCEYIGQCKQRPDGTISAFGNDGKGWNIVLPERVLKVYFGEAVANDSPGQNVAPPTPTTLYQRLLVKQGANADDLKKAYRRLATQWHPDRCTEPHAAEMFISIKAAYDLLNDPAKRRRYDAGLALEATLTDDSKHRACEQQWQSRVAFMSLDRYGYRSPLRCGVLTVDAEMKVGRIIVGKIHSWLDITNELNEVLVTSWNMDTNNYDRRWV